ncbi:hypothetical protein TCAL_03514 [Tigriopus californicus]|uniref:Uncharacterized protein n=1 Tax=Tigriopus californicus TaxID=6832 RepID=A0A553PER5_TIGCA|nr:hypothetical protein TCAL_03514 [Tigriopus californicus]
MKFIHHSFKVSSTLNQGAVIEMLSPGKGRGPAQLRDVLGLDNTLNGHVTHRRTTGRALDLIITAFAATRGTTTAITPTGTGTAAVPLLLDGLASHPIGQTLHVATILTTIPLTLVNDTVLVFAARVGQLLAHGPLEEAFAAFAGINAVMFARGSITANAAKVLGPAQRRVVDRR